MLLNKLIIFYIIYTTLTISITQCDSEDLIITTGNGKIRGRKYKTIGDQKDYYGFRGIPYAEPPIDDLRFKSPVPKRNWNGILDTINDASPCVQNSNPVIGKEDCLYLNVYTPQNPRSTNTLLPVIVFIHGGAFQYGKSTYQELAPDYLLDHDVIIVTFNYRLGVFGFLSTGDSIIPGNYGLKDQLLALKWVKANIRKFGGDNNKITLSGQSAGSASVAYLLQSPLTNNLVNAAILESGVSLSLWTYSRHYRTLAFTVGHDLGLATNNSTELLNHLRAVNASVLQTKTVAAVAFKYLSISPREGFFLAPVIEPEHPDALITEKSYLALANGHFQKVPCIVGFNSLEGTFDITGLLRLILANFDLNPASLVPIDMNINDTEEKRKVGRQIKNFYFGLLPIALSNVNVMRYVGDDQFVRPINQYVRLISKYTNVYFYRFSYEGNLGGVINRTAPGVTHSEELGYLWVSKYNATRQDDIVRSRMLKLWTNFAKYHQPTPHRDGLLQNVDWVPSTVTSNLNSLYYLDIGRNLQIHTNPETKYINFWDQLYKSYATPPFDTY